VILFVQIVKILWCNMTGILQTLYFYIFYINVNKKQN